MTPPPHPSSTLLRPRPRNGHFMRQLKETRHLRYPKVDLRASPSSTTNPEHENSRGTVTTVARRYPQPQPQNPSFPHFDEPAPRKCRPSRGSEQSDLDPLHRRRGTPPTDHGNQPQLQNLALPVAPSCSDSGRGCRCPGQNCHFGSRGGWTSHSNRCCVGASL